MNKVKKLLSLFILFFFLLPFSTHAATLYYDNATADYDWNNSGNWWQDAGFSIPGSVPGVGDDAILTQTVASNSGPAASVNTLTFNDGGAFYFIAINITVASGATFNDNSSLSNSTLTGNAIFNTSSYSTGIVAGNATFNDTTSNYGEVDATATFNTASANIGLLNGQAIFNDSTYNSSTISASTTFNGNSSNNGTITATTTFRGSSINYLNINSDAVFYDSSFNDTTGIVSGNTTLNDTSYNVGTINGNLTINTTYYDATAPSAGTFTIGTGKNWQGQVDGSLLGSDLAPITDFIFNGTATNMATATANVVFNDTSANEGSVTGNATFNTTFYNVSAPSGGIFTVATGKTLNGFVLGTVFGSDASPITSYVFNGNAVNNSAISSLATFNNTSINSGTITGNGIFNNSSYNNGIVTVDATFNNTSQNGNLFGSVMHDAVFNNSSVNASGGYVFGLATYNDTSFNLGTVSGNAKFNTTYYNGSAPSGGTFTVQTGLTLNGTFEGIIYGTDSQVITNFIFNDTSHYNAIVAATTSYVFNNSSESHGTINGNVSYYNTASSWNTVNGDAIYNDTSSNTAGVVNGNATFNDSSTNSYIVNVNAIFNDSSSNTSTGDIYGLATFNGTSYNVGNITGSALFNTTYYSASVAAAKVFDIATGKTLSGSVAGTVYGSDSQVINSYIFHGTANNLATIYIGTTTFNDTSTNNGTVYEDAIFNDSSENDNLIFGQGIFNNTTNNNATVGTAIFNDSSINQAGGFIGITTFNDSTINLGVVWRSSFHDNSINKHFANEYNYFYDNSYNDTTGEVFGDGHFYDLSSNLGHIAGDAFTYCTNKPSLGGTIDGTSYIVGCSMYYNGSADTNWNNILNWWKDAGFARQANFIPGNKDNVYVYNNVVSNSGSAASVNKITLFGTNKHFDINVTTVQPMALYDSTSITGTVTGDAIFNDDLTELSTGTVTGSKTRRYTTTQTTSRDFVATGPWNVIADGSDTSTTTVMANLADTISDRAGGVDVFGPGAGDVNPTNYDWHWKAKIDNEILSTKTIKAITVTSSNGTEAWSTDSTFVFGVKPHPLVIFSGNTQWNTAYDQALNYPLFSSKINDLDLYAQIEDATPWPGGTITIQFTDLTTIQGYVAASTITLGQTNTTITGISSNFGKVGDTITIDGTNLSGVSLDIYQEYFDQFTAQTYAASILSSTPTQLTFTVPSMPLGPYFVTTVGSVGQSNAVFFTLSNSSDLSVNVASATYDNSTIFYELHGGKFEYSPVSSPSPSPSPTATPNNPRHHPGGPPIYPVTPIVPSVTPTSGTPPVTITPITSPSDRTPEIPTIKNIDVVDNPIRINPVVVERSSAPETNTRNTNISTAFPGNIDVDTMSQVAGVFTFVGIASFIYASISNLIATYIPSSTELSSVPKRLWTLILGAFGYKRKIAHGELFLIVLPSNL